MNVLRLNAYFEPEVTAGSHMLNDLYKAFSQNDIRCICYTPQPTRGVSKEIYQEYRKKRYEELYEGYLQVYRFPMFREKNSSLQRAIRYFLCSIIQFYKGTNTKDIDIVFSASTPPTQGMLSAMVAKKLSKKYKKKVPFVYNLQDIFPDSLVNAKMTHKGSLLWKIGRKMEDYTYKNADTIIVISESMKQNIIEKGVAEEKIEVVQNWIDIDQTRPIPKEQNRLFNEYNIDSNKFIVVYAGNFGVAQGADVILEAAKILSNQENIQFVIFGGGAEFESAKQQVKTQGLTNVIINDLLPQDRVSEVYSLGDVALITCKKGVGNSGMPSKTWSIMACNTYIIASFDENSELSHIINDAQAGICVPPENKEQLAEAILHAYNEHNTKGDFCLSSRDYVRNNASKTVCTEKYINSMKKFSSSEREFYENKNT